MHWYFLISSYYLTVSNGCSLTALKSIEFTQHSGSFEWGVYLPLVSTCFLYALVFPYIFLLFDCFKWVLIDHIEKHRVHSALWQFWMGGPSALGIYMFSLCTGISLYLPIIWLFPYIFLLFDCFEWVLIDHTEKRRVHSELWQFQTGREGSSVLPG